MSLTKDKYFIDTNIIIYLFDKRDNDKNRKAIDIVKYALEEGKGIISFQVIQEFCNVALKKFEIPLSIDDCQTFLENYLMPICPIFPGMDIYKKALDTKRDTGFGFYDCLIIASALKGECKILFSEDMQEGYNYKGLRIINPFSA
ncbi:MAG: PIN domain-containing protein [Firmicutes bacterium]|nr:PIN domain-containing protein [Bacillota bacterium]